MQGKATETKQEKAMKISSPFVSIDLDGGREAAAAALAPDAAAAPAAAPKSRRGFWPFFFTSNQSGDSASEVTTKAGEKKDATSSVTKGETPLYPAPRLSIDFSTLNEHALPSTVRDDDDKSDADDGTPGAKKKKPIRKLKAFKRHLFHPRTKPQKAVCGIFWILVAAAIACFFVFAVPPLTKHVLVPLVERVKETMSTPAICAMSFFAMALFPIAFLPHKLFIWILTFVMGTGPALGIAFAGTAVGMALPFLLAKTVMRNRAEKWAKSYVWSATLAETIKEAGPFKSVFLIRLSFLPYNLMNYVLALSPDIHFWKYWIASILGNAPEVVLHVFLGRTLENVFAMVKSPHKQSPGQLAAAVVPLVAALVVALGGIFYGRRALKKVRAARAEHAAQEAAEEAIEKGEGSSGSVVVEVGSTTRKASTPSTKTKTKVTPVPPPSSSSSPDVEMTGSK